MERLFQTHQVRKSSEAAPLWTLRTLDEGGLDQPMRVWVPGVVEQVPKLKNYRGRALYTQKVQCGGNLRFVFQGVSFKARVWLDDTLLCTHYGAYCAFSAVAMNVPLGDHMLKIEADNRFGDDSALHIPNDYYSYGGINRPVIIEEVPSAWIEAVQAVPFYDNRLWSVRVRIVIHHSDCGTEAYALKLRIGNTEMTEAFVPEGSGTTVKECALSCPDAAVWSPEDPQLTTVSAVLEKNGEPVDDLIDRFGFREIRVSGKDILLNGKPLRLKGFNRHEDFNDYGVSVPVEAMMRDLLLFKDLGANCVRTCHYPNDPRFLDLCDEMGILVWEESHARGINEEGMRHPLFMDQLRQCTREMVEQHINHPSIFVWGCLNECADDTEYGEACYREIFDLLRSLDDSRPVTAALLERPGGRVYDGMDVIGVNLYPQWYHKTSVADSIQRKIDDIHTVTAEEKPLIVSEIGAGAIYGYHDPFGEAKWSEERQAAILKDQIESVLNDARCAGLFIWQFADVRVDEEWFAPRPRVFNNKGVVDEYRRPKMAYAVVKKLFSSL